MIRSRAAALTAHISAVCQALHVKSPFRSKTTSDTGGMKSVEPLLKETEKVDRVRNKLKVTLVSCTQ